MLCPRNKAQLLDPLCGLRGCGESVWEAAEGFIVACRGLGRNVLILHVFLEVSGLD